MQVSTYLPAGESFAVHRLAKVLDVHRDHVIHLIDAGELKCAVDLRAPSASRSLIRVPRAAVIEFLESRRIIVVDSVQSDRR